MSNVISYRPRAGGDVREEDVRQLVTNLPSAIRLGTLLGQLQATFDDVRDEFLGRDVVPLFREEARLHLLDLARQIGAAAESADDQGADDAPRVVRGLTRLWRRVERPVAELAGKVATRPRRLLRRPAWPVAVAFSTLIGALVAVGAWLPALVALGARLAYSVGAGGPAHAAPPTDVSRWALPGEDDHALRRHLLSQLASQLCDAVVLGGVAFALLERGRPGLAIVTLTAAFLGIWSSFGREISASIGMRLPRSPVERAFRTGGLAVALVAATWANAWSPAALVPALAVAPVAHAAYAALELARLALRLAFRPVPVRVTTFAFDDRGGCRVTVSDPSPRTAGAAA